MKRQDRPLEDIDMRLCADLVLAYLHRDHEEYARLLHYATQEFDVDTMISGLVAICVGTAKGEGSLAALRTTMEELASEPITDQGESIA
jgi:hypothetical protein